MLDWFNNNNWFPILVHGEGHVLKYRSSVGIKEFQSIFCFCNLLLRFEIGFPPILMFSAWADLVWPYTWCLPALFPDIFSPGNDMLFHHWLLPPAGLSLLLWYVITISHVQPSFWYFLICRTSSDLQPSPRGLAKLVISYNSIKKKKKMVHLVLLYVLFQIYILRFFPRLVDCLSLFKLDGSRPI